jgi:ornithine cyclodeaminase/alanine dehydrogenase-like protein (mu-crystallin family)
VSPHALAERAAAIASLVSELRKDVTEMDDDILQRIKSLVDEEHSLTKPGEPPTDDQHERLRQLEVQLDQCWDLLRQRRARREFGDDPTQAKVRDENIVEHYQQ